MRILAIDIGSTSRRATKSHATCLDTATGEIKRTAFPTDTAAIQRALDQVRPDRIVIEQTVGTGWFVDVCRQHGHRSIQVANPRSPAWCNRSAKTDARDADLLAQLSASGQLTTVHVPEDRIRQWRHLIDYRHQLVRRRTRLKNHIMALLRDRGLDSSHLWTAEGRARLDAMAKPIAGCPIEELWRGELQTELDLLAATDAAVECITTRLDHLVEICPSAAHLAALDGIGPRTAEAVVATLDDPTRFANRKQLGAYLGLVAKVHQSGNTCRNGAITKAGNPIVRAMLTQAVLSSVRRGTGWIHDIYANLLHPKETRKQRAVIATARRVAVILWAKCRDHRRLHPEQPFFDIRPAA